MAGLLRPLAHFTDTRWGSPSEAGSTAPGVGRAQVERLPLQGAVAYWISLRVFSIRRKVDSKFLLCLLSGPAQCRAKATSSPLLLKKVDMSNA